MSRPPNLQYPVGLNLKLPSDLREKLDEYLFDATLRRIPTGAYQRFFIPLIQAELARNGLK